MIKRVGILVLGVFLFSVSYLPAQRSGRQLDEEQELLQVMHSIQSQTLFDYVKELASDKYWGRLSGTDDYNQSAEWVISHFKK
jgi:hypothetical protein